MQWLYDLKLLAVDFTGLEKDALHIYIALLVFCGGEHAVRLESTRRQGSAAGADRGNCQRVVGYPL
ncbi:MAG: hypothetical protein R3D99_10555 [Altererythrobacter sp.]